MTKLEALKAASALLTEHGVRHDIDTHDASIASEILEAGGVVNEFPSFITITLGKRMTNSIMVFAEQSPDAYRRTLLDQQAEIAARIAAHDAKHGGGS